MTKQKAQSIEIPESQEELIERLRSKMTASLRKSGRGGEVVAAADRQLWMTEASAEQKQRIVQLGNEGLRRALCAAMLSQDKARLLIARRWRFAVELREALQVVVRRFGASRSSRGRGAASVEGCQDCLGCLGLSSLAIVELLDLILRIGRDALEVAVDLEVTCEGEVQGILRRSGQFLAAVEKVALTAVERWGRRDDEKWKLTQADSRGCYPSTYLWPLPVEEQIDILRSHWPNLNPDAALRYYREEYSKLQLPPWVEGAFVLIRPGFFSEDYWTEILVVAAALSAEQQRVYKTRFPVWFSGDRDSLRQNEKACAALQALTARQSGSDLLIVPAQFGLRWRGVTPRGVRRVMSDGEFGLGIKDVATMTISHLGRFIAPAPSYPYNPRTAEPSQLDACCLGDELNDPNALGQRLVAPYIRQPFDLVPSFAHDLFIALRIVWIDREDEPGFGGSITAWLAK